eukprot:COSAG01_NODE_33535_length_562_cov_2.323974_1_plen_56_part_00
MPSTEEGDTTSTLDVRATYDAETGGAFGLLSCPLVDLEVRNIMRQQSQVTEITLH